MSSFEKVREDLKQLYDLLMHGEPTPDEETEAKDEILGYLKVLLEDPASDPVKGDLEEAISLAEGWDTWDLWFKEVKGLPRAVQNILAGLGNAAEEAPPAEEVGSSVNVEESPADIESIVEELFGEEEPVEVEQAAPEEEEVPAAGVDVDTIMAEVEKKFASKIEALEGKVQTLEKTVVEKDVEIAEAKKTGKKGARNVPAAEPGEGTGSRPRLAPPKLQAPKMKVPLNRPPNKPFIPKFNETPSAPAPTEEPPEEMPELTEIPQPAVVKPVGVKPVSIKPVSVKPVGIKPVGIKPVAVQPVPVKPIPVKKGGGAMNIPKPVAIKSTEGKTLGPKKGSAKPVSVKPVAVGTTGVRPVSVKPVAGMKPVAVKPVATKPVAVKPVAVKPVGPVSIKPAGVKPITVKPVSMINQPASPASNLAGTLSSIGTKKVQPETQISVRPVSAGASAGPQSSFDPNADLPDSKNDLYSELIALEGRRFAAERRHKELDDQLEKGSLGQVEYRSSVSRAEADLQAIAGRINAIRQKLSTM
ncbi:MAG TPA: hypothetical protein VKK79_13460 [Candidatus Lokiarchaeia archaeon]|nr:hypothetical protein [Candidatus Lokiarchaeia archaeon]